jgi:SAM-dependent methyltransferase
MTHLPFADETIDRITFNASFHHTPDQPRTLEECFRVLKPDGILAMVNEEFGSLRQKLFPGGEVTDGGSHHTIAYRDFQRQARGAGFGVEYFLADHVRQKLKHKLSESVGGLVANTLEAVPSALKQLNSALIVLTKPARQIDVAEATAIPVLEHA